MKPNSAAKVFKNRIVLITRRTSILLCLKRNVD